MKAATTIGSTAGDAVVVICVCSGWCCLCPDTETVVDTDEFPRPQTTMEGLAQLKPLFVTPEQKEKGVAGSVTVGNATGLNNGAAAVLVMTKEEADKRLSRFLQLSSLHPLLCDLRLSSTFTNGAIRNHCVSLESTFAPVTSYLTEITLKDSRFR